MRPLRGGGPSFEVIVQNVINALQVDPDVRMTLRVNINQDNMAEVTKLFDYFPAEIRPRLSLAVEPIFGDPQVSATANLERSAISEGIGEIFKVAESYGFEMSISKTMLLTGRRIYCYAERKRQFIFSPSGSVFKCAEGSFADEDRFGTLAEDGTISEYENRWRDWMKFGEQFSDECSHCVYLPLCMGGCRKVQAFGDGRNCTLIPTNTTYVLKQVSLSGNIAEAMKNALSRGGESQ
jgi:uncharacterized protein